MRLSEKKLLIGIVIFLLLTNVSAFIYALRQAPGNQSDTTYQWLNPQLRYAGEPVVSKAAYVIFTGKLTETIERLKTEGRVTDMAVFFRDLNNGPTFNIDSNDKFIPASLLKLPLVLTYFRLAEEDPGLLSRGLVGENLSSYLAQWYEPAEIMEEGKVYTIEELLYRLIVYSDNRALEVLTGYLDMLSPDESLYLETYKDLGIIDAWYGDPVTAENISIKSYASIFRILYNASYLSKEMSDKALSYLAGSEFNQGLRQGVPENIPIAHKFGERAVEDVFQLHDCGIVYYPQNPYLLCIMTRGDDFGALANAIGVVSKAVYEEFDSRRLR